MLFKNMFAVCSVLATALAAPAPVEAIEDASASPLVDRSELSKRASVDITMYSGDNCGGVGHSYSAGSGISCIPVPSSKRSIRVNAINMYVAPSIVKVMYRVADVKTVSALLLNVKLKRGPAPTARYVQSFVPF